MLPKNNKILLTILMLFGSISLQAADAFTSDTTTFISEFPIYLYGDVSFFATVYEFVKAFTGEILTNGSAIQSVVALGTTLSILIAGWRVKDGGVSAIGMSIIAPMALVALFLVPTVKVHIIDLRVDKGLIDYNVRDGGYRVVEDVPYAIAAIPSISSTIVSFFIDTIDDNWFAVEDGAKFSSLGFQGISDVSKQAMYLASLENLDANTTTDLGGTIRDVHQYVRKCLADRVLRTPGNKYLLKHPSQPFPEMFDPAIYKGNIGAQLATFDGNVDGSGRPVVDAPCAELYITYISGKEAEIEAGMEKALEYKIPTINASSAVLNDAWRAQIGDTANLIGTIGKGMATMAMTRALEQDLEIEGIGVSGVTVATEISIQSTMANLRTEGLAKFEWMSRTLPDAITIIMAVMIGVFPIMIMVMSFYGASAYPMIANYFMGFMAINFNLVGLALVSNIISYYTAQHAQEAIAGYAGMPFGLSQVNGFMMAQADMAGFAGIIGAVAVLGVTPLVFKGESAGMASAVGAIGGMYRGNVAASAQEELASYDAQKTIDDRARTVDGKTDAEAAAWMSSEGFDVPNSMSAVAAYNNMQKNWQQIGAADTAKIMHAGNMDNFNRENYIKGTAGQSMQRAATTAGFGSNMGSGDGQASMADIGSVSIEDGVSQSAMIDKTQKLRDDMEYGYSAESVGAGQAISAHAKNIGSETLDEKDNDANASVANATNAVASQVGAGRGLLETGAFNSDGTLAENGKSDALVKAAALTSAQKTNTQIGMGEKGVMEDFLSTALQDGHIAGFAPTKVAERRGDLDGSNNPNTEWNAENIASGNAISSVHKETQAQGVHNALELEKKDGNMSDAFRRSSSGSEEGGRKSENTLLGVGKEWDKRTETGDDIRTMSKVQDNAAVQEFGGIDATSAEIAKHASSGNGDAVEGAIKDMVTGAQYKGIQSAADAQTLRVSYGNANGSDLTQEKSLISDAQLAQAKKSKQNANEELSERINEGGFDMDDPAEKKHYDALNAKVKAADSVINDAKDNKSMSLEEQSKVLSQQKLDTQLGQALGVEANTAAGVNYAQNAMYGEMSQQQSTKAKLDAQGGVAGAVKVDTTDAQIKAKTQQDVLDAQLKEGGAEDGLKSSADDLSKAADKLAQTAGTLAGVKTASEIKTTGLYDSPEAMADAHSREAVAKEQMTKTRHDFANDENAIERQVGELIKQDKSKGILSKTMPDYIKSGLIKTDENGNYAGVATGDDYAKAKAKLSALSHDTTDRMVAGGIAHNISSGLDGTTIVDIDGETSAKLGNKTSVNTIGTDSASTAMGKEIADIISSPSKWGSAAIAVGGKAGEAVGGETGKSVGQVAGIGIGAALIGYGLNKTSKNLPGMDGKSIYTKAKDKLSGNKSKSDEQPMNSPQHNDTNNPNDNHTKHDSSLNKDIEGNPSSKDSITKSGESVKSIADKHLDGEAKTGKVSPAPNVVGEPRPQYGSPLSEAGHTSVREPSLAQRINSWFSGGESGGKGSGRIKMATSLIAPLATAATAYALSGTDAEAREIPSVSPKPSTPVKPIAPSQTEEVLHAASNVTGAAEMGVGLTTMAADVASRIPGQTGNIAKGIAKFGARVTPGLGLAYGAADGAYRTSQGDYLGASMSAGIAAASTVPVFGTALAVAGGFAQMATDYYGITGGSNSPAPTHAQNAFSTPSGGNTGAAMQADFNAGKVVSFASPQNAPAPAHAQNAFSTPSGFNTSQAMNTGYNPSDSKNAYNDTTSTANIGASSYRTDGNDAQLAQLENISYGTESGQEATEGMSEALEKLTSTIYSSDNGEG